MVHWRAHVVDFVLIAPASVHRPHWTGVRKGRHGSREVAQLGGSPLTRDCGMMGLRAEMKEKDQKERGEGSIWPIILRLFNWKASSARNVARCNFE